MDGLFTRALARATLCCSPPESSFGKERYFSASPTRPSIAGTRFLINLEGVSTTLCAKTIFSYTFLSFRSLKSWNTHPIPLLYSDTFFLFMSSRHLLFTYILPLVGSNSLSSNFISVDFPEPLFPTINTNSPSSISIFACFIAGDPVEYDLLTSFNTIITVPSLS